MEKKERLTSFDLQKEDVIKILNEIRQRAAQESERKDKPDPKRNGKCGPLWHERPGIAEHSGVITVFGERGSGKTTLIRAIAEELRCDTKDLVVGPITPLQFRETKSLFSHVLAAVQHEVFSDHLNPDDCCLEPRRLHGEKEQTEREDLKQAMQDLRNYVARTVPGVMETLVQSGKPGDDFVYHFTTIQDRHLKARLNYPGLIDRLLKDYCNKKIIENSKPSYGGDWNRSLLVVILDDCDLFPDLIQIVLDDIQRMSISPKVAVIFSSNEEALFRAVAENILKSETSSVFSIIKDLSLTSDKQLVDETTRYINKVCPLSQHVWIENNNYYYDDRLNFVPLDSDPNLVDFVVAGENNRKPSLRQLMQCFKFKNQSNPFLTSLLSLFDFAASLSDKSEVSSVSFLRSPYCGEFIPNTWRGLAALYQLLARLFFINNKIRINDDTKEKIDSVIPLGEDESMELIWLMLKSSRYEKLPVEFKYITDRIYWRREEGNLKLEINTEDLMWMNSELMNPVFSIQISTTLNRYTNHLINIYGYSINVYRIRDEGLIPITRYENLGTANTDQPGQSLETTKESQRIKEVRRWRFLGFALDVAKACDLEHLFLDNPPQPHLAPKEYVRPLNFPMGKTSIITTHLPFWMESSFPSYHAFYLYRRSWNDHVSKLAGIRPYLGKSVELSQLNKDAVDYLAMLHIYLIGMIFLVHNPQKPGGMVACEILPLISTVWGKENRNNIKTAVENLKHLLKKHHSHFSPENETEGSGNIVFVRHYCIFLIACSTFSRGYLVSDSVSDWVDENIFKALEDVNDTTKSNLLQEILSILFVGGHVGTLEVRPDGYYILEGIEHLLKTLDSRKSNNSEWKKRFKNAKEHLRGLLSGNFSQQDVPSPNREPLREHELDGLLRGLEDKGSESAP